MIRVAAALAAGTLTCLSAEPIDLSSPELVAEGAKQFAQSCAVGYCHGSEGRSARGPELRDRPWSAQELYRITDQGLPGTSMPGWNGVISDRAIWAVTAYVLSISSSPPSGSGAVVMTGGGDEGERQAELSPEAELGKQLFFDLKRQSRCGVCHRLGALGTAIGPNLALAARSRSKSELIQDILDPHRSVAFGFELVELHLHSGERIRGVVAEETETRVRLFDSGAVPPPRRTAKKSDIRAQAIVEGSAMPANLDETYSPEELGAIAAFLWEAAGREP